MSFWNMSSVEPKRKYRWFLTVGSLGDEVKWLLKTASKPAWNVTEHAHKFINHTFHYPARVEWQPMDIALVDAGDPDVGHSFLHMLRLAGYNFPTDLNNGSQTITKSRAVGALGSTVTISQFGADGDDLIDKWKLVNPFFTNIKTGDGLTYEADDLVEVTATIVYDYAYLERAGSLPGGLNSIKGFRPSSHDTKIIK